MTRNNARFLLLALGIALPLTFCVAQSKKRKAPTKPIVVEDTIPPVPQDRIDTLYYDNNWHPISNKIFASYYRFALYPANPSAAKKIRTYYISGELEGEGDFTQLSTTDDKQSKLEGKYVRYHKSGQPSVSCHYREGVLEGKYETFDEEGHVLLSCTYLNGKEEGEHITYFKNGKPSVISHYEAGTLNGPQTTYYESGLIHEHVILKNGKKDGIESVFSENGEVCTQSLYADGNRSEQYMLTDKKGNCSLYRVADDSPVYVKPSPDELKTEYKNGAAWHYYHKNGIILGVSQIVDDAIGSYREFQFFLSNNSMNNTDIDPATITAYMEKKDGERKTFEFMSAEDYYEKIYKRKKKNAKKAVKNKAVVEKEKQNYLNGNLGATVFDENMNTLTVFQNRMIQKQELVESTHVMADNKAEDVEYLRRTTVHPGESVFSYLLTDNKKADFLHLDVTVGGILYPYIWDLRKKK